MNNFWTDRPTIVTGASGLVGSWLVRDLLSAGADVICFSRDHVPQSVLELDGLAQQVKCVRGDVRDIACVQRAIKEYEASVVFHLAAQTIVGVANRDPLFTFESNVQ